MKGSRGTRPSELTLEIVASARSGHGVGLSSYPEAKRAYNAARAYVARHGLPLRVFVQGGTVWAERREGTGA